MLKPDSSQREKDLLRAAEEYRQEIINSQKQIEQYRGAVTEHEGSIKKLHSQILLKDSELIKLTHENTNQKLKLQQQDQDLQNQRHAY